MNPWFHLDGLLVFECRRHRFGNIDAFRRVEHDLLRDALCAAIDDVAGAVDEVADAALLFDRNALVVDDNSLPDLRLSAMSVTWSKFSGT